MKKRASVGLPGVTLDQLDAAVEFFGFRSREELVVEAIIDKLQTDVNRWRGTVFQGEALPEPSSLRDPSLRECWLSWLDPRVEAGDPLKLSLVIGPAGLDVFESFYEVGPLEELVREAIADNLEVALRDAIFDAQGKCLGWKHPE